MYKDMEVVAVGRIVYFVLKEVLVLTRTSVDSVEEEFFGKHVCKQRYGSHGRGANRLLRFKRSFSTNPYFGRFGRRRVL